MSNYDLMSKPQRNECFINISKAPELIGALVVTDDHKRFALTDIKETMRGTQFVLTAANGFLRYAFPSEVTTMLLPDGRWLRR